MPRDTDFPCSYCVFTSKYKRAVVRHTKLVHDRRRDYKCSLCEFAAGTRQNLSQHTKEVHEKIKDIECEHCDYKCSMLSRLTQHVKIVHEGIKEYKCTVCGKQFGTNWELKCHIKNNHKKDKWVPANTQENKQDQGDHIAETTCAMCGFTSSKISELACHYYAHFPVPDINLNKSDM